VLGADHHGYVPRLKAALNALGVDESKLDVVLMQMVMLVRNGEVVKRNPNFRFFATMNMGYFGTKELNQALFNRFSAIIENKHRCRCI